MRERELLTGPVPEPSRIVPSPPSPGGGDGKGFRNRITGSIIVLVVLILAAAAVLHAVQKDDHVGQTDTAANATNSTSPSAPLYTYGQGKGMPTAGKPWLVLAQRGSEDFPHDTLPGLLSAAKSGSSVQADVWWTSDNVPILIHEGTTKAPGQATSDAPMDCSGGPYVVARTSWKVLSARCTSIRSASKDGKRYPIPTLDAAMKAIADVPGVRFVPEIKAENATLPQLEGLLTTIEKYGMVRRVVVASWFVNDLSQLHDLANDADGIKLPLMYYERANQAPRLMSIDGINHNQLAVVAIRAGDETPAYVAQIKKTGALVLSWEVDTPTGWAAALKAKVIVQTDQPLAFQAWLKTHSPAQ